MVKSRNLLIAIALMLGVSAALAQTPLTPFFNLRVKTDTTGALYVTNAAAVAPDTPLTAMSNLRGKTDSNGALYVTCTGCGGSGGGLVLLEQHTASSSASLDFTTFISSTYDEYRFELIGVLPATDAVDLVGRVGTGGGPTWDTGSNYYWFFIGQSLLGQISGQGNPGTSFKIGPTIENSVTGVGGDFTLYNPQDATGRKVLAWNTVGNFSDGNVGRMSGGAIWATSTALTGVQFLYSSGNIASGTIRAYGVEK